MSWGSMMAADHDHQLGWGMVEEGWRKGPWTAEEDRLLIEYVKLHGEGRWNCVSRLAGLKRNGKSCRLRWVNYLRPDLKRGQITPHEERIILDLHARWGNRWSTIARSLPGRTDNEIKNYWRTHFKKKTKGSSSSDHSTTSEKSKARLLKRQQFQLQQQQQQIFDMKKLMSLLDETDDHHLHQPMTIKRDIEAITPTTSTTLVPNHHPHHYYYSAAPPDHQVFLQYYSMFNGYVAAATMAPEGIITNDQDNNIIWDGLWNLDDVNYGNMNYTRNALYHASSAATPFC